MSITYTIHGERLKEIVAVVVPLQKLLA